MLPHPTCNFRFGMIVLVRCWTLIKFLDFQLVNKKMYSIISTTTKTLIKPWINMRRAFVWLQVQNTSSKDLFSPEASQKLEHTSAEVWCGEMDAKQEPCNIKVVVNSWCHNVSHFLLLLSKFTALFLNKWKTEAVKGKPMHNFRISWMALWLQICINNLQEVIFPL